MAQHNEPQDYHIFLFSILYNYLLLSRIPTGLAQSQLQGLQRISFYVDSMKEKHDLSSYSKINPRNNAFVVKCGQRK